MKTNDVQEAIYEFAQRLVEINSEITDIANLLEDKLISVELAKIRVSTLVAEQKQIICALNSLNLI